MNIRSYEQYKEYEGKGLKKQATASLREFVSSFEDESEIESWVWSYLPQLEKNRHFRIRHEIFTELVYPTLKRGYINKEFDATLWLGKLVQNVYQTKVLHEELDWVTEYQLYLKSYELDPGSTEAKGLLLNTMVRQLEYAIHEWPSGILWGNDGANIEQCAELSKELEFARELDCDQNHGSFFSDFKEKLSEYRARLNK